MRYRPEIDGLRTVAVLPVILFHAGFPAFSGGFIGVDIFFVISGYLITAILLRELEEGRFSILRFYERRIRRIFPALFFMMAATTPFAWLLLDPFAFRNYAQSLVATTFSASNILFWLESGYFDVHTELKPLLHTWSLAVEEQYYVILPVMLFLLWRLGKRSLFVIVGLFALASLGLAEWMSRNYPSASFYLLPARAWELFAGSLCAFWQNARGMPKGGRAGGVAAALGLASILGSIFTYEGTEILWPSLWTLVPVGGTALIILCAGPGTAVMRLLSSAPFVGIGLISYSAYLWHQPVFAFARTAAVFEPSHAVMLSLAALSMGLAWASWRFVEAPFRNSRPCPDGGTPRGPWLEARPALFSVAALIAAVFVLAGLTGSESRLQAQSWRARQIPAALDAREIIDTAIQEKTIAYRSFGSDPESCVFLVSGSDEDADYGQDLALSTGRMAACAERYGPGVAVLGDSHANDLFGIAARHMDRPFILGVTSGGCRAFAPARGCPYDPFVEFLTINPGLIDMVLFEQAGFYLLDGKLGNHDGRPLLRGLPLETRVPDYPLRLDRIEADIAYLERITPHAGVIWLGMRPGPHIPYPLVMRAGCDGPWRLRENQLDLYRDLDARIATELAGTGIRYVPQVDLMAPAFPEDFMNCDRTLWTDGDHLSLEGIDHFGPALVLALDTEISLAGSPARPGSSRVVSRR